MKNYDLSDDNNKIIYSIIIFNFGFVGDEHLIGFVYLFY